MGRSARAAARGDPAAARGSRSTSTTSACWARQTIVPLTIVGGAPARARRSPFSRRTELRTGRPRTTRAGAALDAGRAASSALDRALHRYERRPLRPPAPLARSASRASGSCGARRRDGSLGRHPAALGVLDACARSCSGYPLDHPVAARRRSTGSTASRSREDGAAPARGVPVAGLGHRARDDRAARRGRRRRLDPALAPRGGLAAARGDPHAAATGRCGARTSSRRLGVRVRERPLPRRRRHRRGDARARAAARTGDAPTREAALARALALDARHAVARTAASRRSTPTTRARSAASCRSATSAR